MRRVVLLLIVLIVTLTLVAQVAPQVNRRNITEKDIFDFVWIGDPQISPDGSRVAFVRVTVNDKKDGYDTAIWTVSTTGNDRPYRLTIGPRDTEPRWSPDGKMLAFVRGSEREGRPGPAQINLISLSGGEPWALTTLPRGASSPTWSPDGKRIAFLSQTTPDDLAKQEREKKGGRPADAERESDVKVITRAVYRFNGRGYIDPLRHAHIWVVDVPVASDQAMVPKQITSGEFDENDPEWAPDGAAIYFTSTRVREPYYDPPASVLYSVPAAGGEITKIAAIDGQLSDCVPAPQGGRIACRGTIRKPVRSYDQPDLFVVEQDGKVRNLTASLDADIGSGLSGDQHAPRGGGRSSPVWSADGKAILDVVAEKGTANLRRFDAAGGQASAITSGNQEIETFSVTPDGSKMVVLISTPTLIGDLYAVAPGGKLTRLTDVNQKLFSQLNLSEPEELWYQSFDGKRIHAWIQKPPDFQQGKKYPLILNIHGGPHAAYGYTFDHEFHWMAAKGYIVLYPNPRGSSTYGQDFGNIIQYRYPGDDFKDLMAGVDELIKRGLVDEKKLGVTGGSGGGILTNWVVTHTDRFAAAVAQRSIADWSAFWYDADFTLFTPSWFRAAPWQDPQDFAARSPITYAAKMTTPLMLIEGEEDYRTPPAAGGEQMFRAMKYLRKPVVMVRFPGESHELSRSGRPWHRIERLQHIVRWFDIYLQSAVNPYDISPVQSMPQQPTSPGQPPKK